MRRFTPFIVIGLILLFFMIIGLIFEKPNGSFSIWNQIQPPSKFNISSIIPRPDPGDKPGGGKPSVNLLDKV